MSASDRFIVRGGEFGNGEVVDVVKRNPDGTVDAMTRKGGRVFVEHELQPVQPPAYASFDKAMEFLSRPLNPPNACTSKPPPMPDKPICPCVNTK